MALLTLLLALLPALPALGATTESLQLTTPPTRTCKYTFPDSGFTYDLCPLFASKDARRGTIAWETPTPPSITATEYRWSLDGPLRKDGTLLDRNQCPEGTWVCQTVRNTLATHRSDPARITQLVPIAGFLKASSNHGAHAGHEDEDEVLHDTDARPEATYNAEYWRRKDVLTIRLHGGSYVQKPHHALFVFLCEGDASAAPNLAAPPLPTYAYNWNGTHVFTWRTPHACPVSARATSTRAATPAPTETDADPERPPPDDTDGDGRAEDPAFDDLPARPTRGARVRGGLAWAAFAFLALALAFALRAPARRALGPLVKEVHERAPALPRALRRLMDAHPLAPLYRRFTFRVGERTLVRWAREEAGYTGVPGDGDGVLDFEVTEEEEGRWLEDEMIPLTPSPGPRSAGFGKKAYAGGKRDFKGYGTA